MTLQLVGGPNATATSSISTRQSLAFACLSPEPATSSYDFAPRTFTNTGAPQSDGPTLRFDLKAVEALVRQLAWRPSR
jgi:hypothetical protein